VAAPLADAALTSYHAIFLARGRLAPGSTAVVVGVGGLGHMAVQILRATTAAAIVAVDTDEKRLRAAVELGADQALASEAQATEGDPAPDG
jgi:alcohol dehydrogenase, propanol-preferring